MVSVLVTNLAVKDKSRGLGVGDRKGRLTIIGHAFRIVGHWHVVCRCDCGRTTVVHTSNIAYDKTTSCGCVHKEVTSNRVATHRGSWIAKGKMNRLYHTWLGMKDRCKNPKNASWKYYGAKGIRVREPWLSDFAAFQEWALSHGYNDKMTIDRIDSNQDYFAENCQWLSNVDNVKRSRGTLA